MLRIFILMLCALAAVTTAVGAQAVDATTAPAAAAAGAAAAVPANDKPTPAAIGKTPPKAADGAPAMAGARGYSARPEVRALIDEMVSEHGYDRTLLRRAFAAAQYQPQIITAMQRPLLEPPAWYNYAPQFISPARIDGGVAYWNAHVTELDRAEAEFGVPAEIVVAILGIETYYGRYPGRYRVLDALATLAFDYPRRAAFFRGELKQFLLLARELDIPLTAPKGSFAGAMGVPQFMPGSYRNFAIDFDGDGRTDLWTSDADIVGSVAHYLVRHDWARGQPVLLAATIADEHRDVVLRRLDGGLSERRAQDAWAADGVAAQDSPADLAPDPVGLLMLEEKTGDVEGASYWIAYNNFYVITRYNRSRLYASAVWQLAQAIKAAR